MSVRAVGSKRRGILPWRVRGLLVLLCVAIVMGLLMAMPGMGIRPEAANRMRAENRFQQLQAAVGAYYTEYGKYPGASGNRALIDQLAGANPKAIDFIDLRPSERDARGQLLDPWGTPLHIEVTAHGTIHIRSAGPDREFGTADDITNAAPVRP